MIKPTIDPSTCPRLRSAQSYQQLSSLPFRLRSPLPPLPFPALISPVVRIYSTHWYVFHLLCFPSLRRRPLTDALGSLQD